MNIQGTKTALKNKSYEEIEARLSWNLAWHMQQSDFKCVEALKYNPGPKNELHTDAFFT